jgi:predicted nuclease of predicted toxin-antitoxin system
VSNAITTGLRRRGIDVTTTLEARLSGRSDREHLEYALKTSRVVYTQDSDFLILAASGAKHCGVVYSVPNARAVRQIIDFLALLDGCLETNDMIDAVEFVPER